MQQIPIFSGQQRATLEAPLMPKKKRDLETNYKRKAGLAPRKETMYVEKFFLDEIF